MKLTIVNPNTKENNILNNFEKNPYDQIIKEFDNGSRIIIEHGNEKYDFLLKNGKMYCNYALNYNFY